MNNPVYYEKPIKTTVHIKWKYWTLGCIVRLGAFSNLLYKVTYVQERLEVREPQFVK
jgi:hypothetical protein